MNIYSTRGFLLHTYLGHAIPGIYDPFSVVRHACKWEQTVDSLHKQQGLVLGTPSILYPPLMRMCVPHIPTVQYPIYHPNPTTSFDTHHLFGPILSGRLTLATSIPRRRLQSFAFCSLAVYALRMSSLILKLHTPAFPQST
jgi:hypothetical protein